MLKILLIVNDTLSIGDLTPYFNETWEIRKPGMNTTSKLQVTPVYFSHFQHLLIVTVTVVISVVLVAVMASVIYGLSLFIWPVLSLVLSGKLPPPPQCLLMASLEKGAMWGLSGPGLGHHVAQEIAALCSLAFIRSAAMLEDLRSGSTLRS